MKKILITGAAGYIGSHCVLNMLRMGYDIVAFDNLSTGHIETINDLKKIKEFDFIKGDLKNIQDINYVFKNTDIDAVIHFAAYSQVNESIKNPKKYYENNVLGGINLLNSMVENNVKKIIFSSTAAIYGNPSYIPIDENHSKNPINPYGNTKLILEKIMDEYDIAYKLKSVRLRYFNVAGADKDSIVGEWHDMESHLIPNILLCQKDETKEFNLFGCDWDTPDGTCIRDYINIDDLIDAHILALDYLNRENKTDFFNLGTKTGSSTKEVFELCQKIIKKKIKVQIKPKREGDTKILVADNKKARKVLGWSPKRTLSDSIITAQNYFLSKI